LLRSRRPAERPAERAAAGAGAGPGAARGGAVCGADGLRSGLRPERPAAGADGLRPEPTACGCAVCGRSGLRSGLRPAEPTACGRSGRSGADGLRSRSPAERPEPTACGLRSGRSRSPAERPTACGLRSGLRSLRLRYFGILSEFYLTCPGALAYFNCRPTNGADNNPTRKRESCYDDFDDHDACAG
jgi:hypothetical protein